DARLLDVTLGRSPGTRIDLYGPCTYAGRGSDPSPQLAELLGRLGDRLAWHGPVSRDRVPGIIDAADAGLPPLRAELARGDIMKVYDYAGRGRPIVATRGVVDAELGPVPGLLEADDPDGFAAAVERALADGGAPERARAWAEQNAWDARWDA